MDQDERRVIEDLFDKLRRVESEAPPRDPEAENLIRRRIGEQPGAPYHMAQAIVVQEHALAASQARLRELERELARRPAGSGFLSGLFGGGEQSADPRGATPGGRADLARYRHAGGGGFLGGAMQTALGVAGGVLIADAITDLFSGNEAAAAEPPAENAAGDLPGPAGAAPGDEGLEEDFGGFFGDEEF
jgi:uncharacterized protein